MHFGLGAYDTAEVRVTWPKGSVSDWAPVHADGVFLGRPRRGRGPDHIAAGGAP
ncbi:MAG: ASPIC/UnbV domain-containing protein [Paracoccaceae bacterium]